MSKSLEPKAWSIVPWLVQAGVSAGSDQHVYNAVISPNAAAELTLAPGPAVDLGSPTAVLAPAPEPASDTLAPDQIVLIQFRLVLIGEDECLGVSPCWMPLVALRLTDCPGSSIRQHSHINSTIMSGCRALCCEL